MIKVIISVVCAVLASLGGAFGAFKYKVASQTPPETKVEPKYETVKTRMVSIPIIVANEVKGYVVTRLEFVGDVAAMKSSGVPTESIVADEAFKVVYRTAGADFKLVQNQNLSGVTEGIAAGVNKRMGKEVVKEVMIDSWTFLRNVDGKNNDEQSEH